jgi:hypothetical protein
LRYDFVSAARDQRGPCPFEFSSEGILDPCGEDELLSFVALIEHLGLPVNLGEELSIVERQPDLS